MIVKRGYVQIYTGDGKGKTTAAMGLALRAAGNGLSVRIFQFCKNTPSGELFALKKLDRVTLQRAEHDCAKFTWDMNEAERAEWLEAHHALFDAACEAACEEGADLVILDEALGAMHAGAVDQSQLLYLMTHKNKGTELVLTGRDAPQALIEAADYATEMRMVKHPYEQGVPARKGREY